MTRARSITETGLLLSQFKLLCERRNQAPNLKAAVYTSIQIGLIRVELKDYYHVSNIILTAIERDSHTEVTDDTTPDL